MTDTALVAKDESPDERPDEHGVFLGHYKGISIVGFAKDLLLFGNSRVVEVCDAYNISDTLFKEIVELPAFKKEMRELRSLIESSPNALIQLKARTIVERGLEEMQQIVFSGARDADRIKAMEFLAKVGGIQYGGAVAESTDNGKPQASGMVLNVNLGPNGLIPPLSKERRPLRRVDEIMDVIDVKPNK